MSNHLRAAPIALGAIALVIGIAPTWQLGFSDYPYETVIWYPAPWVSAWGYGDIGVSVLWDLALIATIWLVINFVRARPLLWPGVALIASLAVLPLALNDSSRPTAVGWVGLACIMSAGLLAIVTSLPSGAQRRSPVG